VIFDQIQKRLEFAYSSDHRQNAKQHRF